MSRHCKDCSSDRGSSAPDPRYYLGSGAVLVLACAVASIMTGCTWHHQVQPLPRSRQEAAHLAPPQCNRKTPHPLPCIIELDALSYTYDDLEYDP